MASIIPRSWDVLEKDSKGNTRVVTRKAWQVQIRLKGFAPVIETFDRKTDAVQWAQKTEADMRRGMYFPEREAERRTLAGLVERYVVEVCPKKKDGRKQARQLAWWVKQLGQRRLVDCTPAVLAEARQTLSVGREGATVNRYIAALSHAFTIAVKEWGWMRDNPMLRVSKERESRGRVRMLSAEEEAALLDACRDGPAYLYPVTVLALRTGMRFGEIVGLTWADVSLEREFVTLNDTKNGDRRGVPLDSVAVQVLRSLEGGERSTQLFAGTSSFRHAWGRAVKRAGLTDFHFHDLRHTAASHFAMSGATPSEIADLLGHRTLAMVKRYAHLSQAHLRRVMERREEVFPLQGERPKA